MIGGLMKSSSRLAIAAAASLFVGGYAMTPSHAADLGGDCCADLEERVAELVYYEVHATAGSAFQILLALNR